MHIQGIELVIDLLLLMLNFVSCCREAVLNGEAENKIKLAWYILLLCVVLFTRNVAGPRTCL